MRRVLMAIGAGLVALAPVPVLAQLRLPSIPGLPGGVPIPPVPRLGELLSDRPPVSTSLEDAQTELTLLDVTSSAGDRSEVVYDDRIAPRPHPTEPELVAYAFQTVRLVRPNPTNLAQPQQVEIQNQGWAFTHAPRRTASNPAMLALCRCPEF